jgi:putative hydrolase of the HAD superfamily
VARPICSSRVADENGFPHLAAMATAQTIVTEADRPDFRHVRTWVFDLDHTLYRLEAGATKDVEERICRFVQRHLELPRDEAWAVQKKYLHEYGITLAGLMKHHDVDPDLYHAEINDIDALGLAPDDELRAALRRLPGPKLVFTNNCGKFAREVLVRLAIDDLFAEILDIRALGYVPKPARGAYDRVVARAPGAPPSFALFDDRACNLEPAHALGMTTVWLSNGTSVTTEESAFIDFETGELSAFLQSIRI